MRNIITFILPEPEGPVFSAFGQRRQAANKLKALSFPAEISVIESRAIVKGIGMPTSEAPVYLHLIWTTKRREPTIPLEHEREVFRVIRSEALKMRCKVIAVNGTDDHLHMLVQFGRFVTFSRFVNQVKGVSSSFINSKRDDPNNPPFRWQEGYGIFSFGLTQISVVTAYIDRQKEHHASGELWPEWEMTDPM